MKASRTIVGIILLLGGTYVVVGEHFAGTSSFATVNARIYTVRSPIDGQVSLALKGIGSRVNAGEFIAEIVDDRFDSSRLLDLERGQDLLAIEARRIETQRTALVAAKEVFERQVADYQRGRIAQINARIAESQAIEDSAQARLREADSGLRRARDLSERGVQTAANLERASAARDVAQQDVESARQRRNYLLTELASARSGVFIGDSYNDAPFSLQRVRELELRIAEIVAEREQAEARIAQNERQIRAERLRINRLTNATLNARVSGMAWDFMLDDGEFARRGQDLVRLVDCNNLIVTASASEALYDKLKIGAPVQFRPYGDNRTFDGTIIRLGGAGAATLYGNLAVGPSARNLERFDVTVSVPGLSAEPDLSCAVGRTGRVIFTSGPVGQIRKFLARYGL